MTSSGVKKVVLHDLPTLVRTDIKTNTAKIKYCKDQTVY